MDKIEVQGYSENVKGSKYIAANNIANIVKLTLNGDYISNYEYFSIRIGTTIVLTGNYIIADEFCFFETYSDGLYIKTEWINNEWINNSFSYISEKKREKNTLPIIGLVGVATLIYIIYATRI